MASSETSFESYSFTYKWTVKDLGTFLYNPSKLSSPTFNSSPGTKPATQWKVTLFKESSSDQTARLGGLTTDGLQTPVAIEDEFISLNLECLNFNAQNGLLKSAAVLHLGTPVQQPFVAQVWPKSKAVHRQQRPNDPGMWIEVHLNILNFGCSQRKVGPVRMSPNAKIISFNKCLNMSKVGPSSSPTFELSIQVMLLDKPVHVDKEKEHLNRSIHVPEFNLGKRLEEDRRNNLFTDVMIVTADKKEFRAHKVVLASQSKFFKTRFSSRWMTTLQQSLIGQSGNKVEMTDVSATVMEAMISYMYTGEVAGIETIAMDVLPLAEVYGLEGLRKLCERALAKSLNIENAVDILVHANAYNAQDLKKVCIDYICLNIAPIRKSEGWKKLKETETCHELCVDLLDKVTCANN